jgi:hypothetical protein
MNSVNRAMGMRDLYPFLLSPGVLIKLDFIHRMVQNTARGGPESGLFQDETAVCNDSQMQSEQLIAWD